MASATELFKAWKEGFDNKDSSRVAGFLTDDFQYRGQHTGSKSKQETLDWIGAGGNPTTIDDLELLYENDEIAVLMRSAEGSLGRWPVQQKRMVNFLVTESSAPHSKWNNLIKRLHLVHVDGNHQMVVQQDMMARQMVLGEIDAPLEDIGVYGAGMAFELAGDNLHPVAAAESVVETHALQGIGLAGAGARNGCQSISQNVSLRVDVS